MPLLALRPAIVAVSVAAAAFCAPVLAQSTANPVKTLLGQASDQALDKLSQPGAFSADDAIRIALPGASQLGKVLDLASKAGVTGDVNGSLNRAAEQAAAQAKPIFRAAIDKATLSDGLSALKSNTGATDYLKKSAGSEVQAQLLPLVRAALEQAGVFQQTSQLSAIGYDANRLTDYVAGKTSDGIFTYVGREETRLRANPLEAGKNLLQGVKGLKF